MAKVRRAQVEFYGLFVDFLKKDQELFWRKSLRRIKRNNLSDFEKRIKEKFPKAWKKLKAFSKEPFSEQLNRRANIEYFKDIVRQIKRQTGLFRFVIFTYAIEKNGLYNSYCPWKFSDGKYWLGKAYRKFYFPLFRRFNNLLNDVGCKPIWVILPGKYGDAPFKNNHEKVPGPWELKARPYLGRFCQRMRQILEKVFENKSLHIQGSNEVSHMGSKDLGVKIFEQHDFIFQQFDPLIPISRYDCDVTKSDFTLIKEVEYYCILKDEEGKEYKAFLHPDAWKKAKEDGSLVRTIKKIGNDDYNRHAWVKMNSWYPAKFDEPVSGENPKLWKDFLVSIANKKFILSTDGNGVGSGEEYPGGTFRNLTYDELYDFVSRSMELEKQGIQIINSDLPKETYAVNSQGIIAEDWSLINIDRLKAIRDAREKE